MHLCHRHPSTPVPLISREEGDNFSGDSEGVEVVIQDASRGYRDSSVSLCYILYPPSHLLFIVLI